MRTLVLLLLIFAGCKREDDSGRDRMLGLIRAPRRGDPIRAS